MLTQKSAEERFSLKDGTSSQLKGKLKLVESLVTVVVVSVKLIDIVTNSPHLCCSYRGHNFTLGFCRLGVHTQNADFRQYIYECSPIKFGKSGQGGCLFGGGEIVSRSLIQSAFK